MAHTKSSKKANTKKATAKKKTATKTKTIKKPTKTAKKASTAKSTTRKSSTSKSTSTIDHSRRQQMIAEAAYYNALQRGFSPGNDMDDWLIAEAQVDKALSGK